MIANTTLTNNLSQTLRYVMDKATQPIYVNFTDGLSGDVAKMAEAMEATAATHRSTRMQRVGYHISLSPAIEDQLTVADWMNLAQDFIQELDAEAHQVVAALHDDTTYPDSDRTRVHAHFVINRPSNCGSLNLTYPQIERVVRQLEHTYQLTAVPCSWEVHYQKGQAMSSPSVTSTLQLEQLLAPTVQNYLQGERGQSKAEYGVYHTARECYGWHSWCQANALELGGNPEVLIGQAAEAMGIASEQVAGILSGLDPAQCMPSAAYKGGDVAAWKHIAKLDRSLFEEKCPPELSEQVRQSLRSFAQDTPSEDGVRPLQTMGEVMRSAQPPTSLNANPNSRHLSASPVARVGQVLTYTGEHLTRQADEVDGRTVIGATTTLTGAALILGNRILQTLQTPEGKDYSERVDRIVTDLQEIEERTGAIETQHQANRIDGINEQFGEIEERTVALEEQLGETTSDVSSSPTGTAEVTSEEVEETETIPDETARTSSDESEESEQEQGRESTVSVEADEVEFPFEERLSQLEQVYQVEVQPGKFPPIHIDRSASIDRQLDQIEAAIAQFKTRLDRLEQVIFPQQERQQAVATVASRNESTSETVAQSQLPPRSQVSTAVGAEVRSPDSSPVSQSIASSGLGQSPIQSERSPEALSGEAIAERLYNYTCARAEVYGLHPQDRVNTTMGVIGLTTEPTPIISLADEQYGTKFEAGFVNGKWNVVTNDFSPTEISRLEDIPQTPEAYTQQANAKDLIRYFQTKLPQEFQKEQGRIVWEDEPGQPKYEFEITSRHTKQNIVGRQGDEVVFSAQIDAEGILRTQTCQIPTEQIDALLHPPVTQVKQAAL